METILVTEVPNKVLNIDKDTYKQELLLYNEQKIRNKSQRMKNEYIKLQMMEFYMTNRGLTCSEIIICVLDASFDAGIAALLTVILIYGVDRIDKYLRTKAGEVVGAVVEGAQMVGDTVVDAAETVRDNSAIVDEGATLIGNIVSTGDWMIGGIFGSVNRVFDYGSKAQNGKVSCPFCEESAASTTAVIENITIASAQVIQEKMEYIPILPEQISISHLVYNEITSIPGVVLCLVFLWKLKVYYVQEREKKERLRTSVVFGSSFSPIEKNDGSQKKESMMSQFIRSI